MANIQDTIARQFPEASFETADTLMVNIPQPHLHDLVKALRDDAQTPYDYLVTIVGMDWKTSLGCIYYLACTATREVISIKAEAAGYPDTPYLPSIADLYRIAVIYEREVYDFFGIVFLGNPDMRRMFLNIDWVGYPLRKDYDINTPENAPSIENERQSDFTQVYALDADGKPKAEQRRIFQENDFVVNIGPQHPATHGVLRFRTAIDGEQIKKIDVYMGYIHRGVEKLCEDLQYMQTLHYMDRLDYFSAHPYHHGLCLCIEKAAGIEVPRRAQILRVMMDELSRIASHCLFMGTFCMDLGATTMLFYTLRVREQILDIMDRTCGARMTFNYEVIGGVMAEPDPNFINDVKALIEVVPKNLKEYNKIFTGNVIAKNRMEGVGVLSRDEAISWGITGPSGRASGWQCDVRKNHPYAVYSELNFEPVMRTEGDSMARFRNRLEECQQSADILTQLVDLYEKCEDKEICAKVPKILKLPVGRWFQMVEGCRGVFGVYIESDGTNKPYRMKFATPGLPAASVVDTLTRGQKIADLITIGGSMDYIVPDMDR